MQPAEDSRLAEILGIEPGMDVSVFNSPNFFELELGDLPDGVEVHRDAQDAPSDLFLIFADRSDEAERGFERAVTNMARDGVIWFAWPKEPSDRISDLDERALKDLFEPHGMTSERSTSIDDEWNGLRFVVAESAEWPPPTD